MDGADSFLYFSVDRRTRREPMHGMAELTRLLAKIQSGEAAATIELYGVPGLYDAPLRWDTGDIDLGSTHLVYYGLQGRFEAASTAGRTAVGPSDLLWMLAGNTVRLRRVDDSPLVFYRLRVAVAEAAAPVGDAVSPVIHFPAFREAEDWMGRLVLEAGSPSRFSRIRGRALLSCLIAEAVEYTELKETNAGLSRSRQLAVERFIAESVAANPRLAAAAHAAELSPDYFSRQFRRTYGCSFRRYVVERRIRLARSYIRETTFSIGRIAELLGYGDIFHFSRQFKQVMGYSPSRERRVQQAVTGSRPSAPGTRRRRD